MALKDFNYKQFFFDHGEHIGMGVAGALALLLALPLFWPGSGFLARSAGANAYDLDTVSQTVETGLARNTPGPDDTPGDPTDKLVAFNFDLITDQKAKDYRIADLFNSKSQGSGGRQMPGLKLPNESDLALVRFQLPALVYSKDYEYIETLKGAGNMTGPPGSPPAPGGTGGGPPNAKDMAGFGAAGLQNNLYAQRQMRHGLVRDKNNPDTDKTDKDLDVEWVKTDNRTGKTPAIQAFPVRGAEIVASFPYKEQILEFQNKLNLPSDAAVLAELSTELDPDGKPLPSFRFLGVRVERRQLDAQGKPAADWAPLDLEEPYKALLILNDKQVEDEDPKLQQVIIPELLMPKLLTLGAQRTPPVDEYPKLEDGLKSLADALNALKGKAGAPVPKPATQLPGSVFGFKNPNGAAAGPGGTGAPPGGSGPPGGTPRPGGSGPPGGTPRPGGSAPPGGTAGPGGAAPEGQNYAVPDSALVRLFDVTIEPGKTYEYRMQVRMANPNYGHKDAASQGYADEKELPAKDWYVVPKKLVVPQDLYYYAVDQAKIDGKEGARDSKDKEPKLPVLPVKEGQTTLQIQKWIDYIHNNKTRLDMPVGDWVIAERVVATRGEPVGRQRAEVPYWRTTMNKFAMMTDQPPPKASDRRFVASVDVPFAPDGEEPILVDFTGGDRVYVRTHPDPAAPAELPVADKAAEEVLLLTYDGKLLAHNGSSDEADADRVKRVEEQRRWIDDVKHMKAAENGNKLFP